MLLLASINSVLTYNANLSPAQAQLKALTGQVGALSAAFNTLDKSAVRAQSALASTFLANVGQIGGFTTQMVQSGTAVDNFGRALAKQRLTMRQYFREAIAGYTKQNSMMKQLAAQQVRMQQSMMVPMGVSPGGGGRAAILTPTSLNAMSNAAALASQKFSIFNELIRGGSERLLNFGKNTQWTGRQLMVGFTLPLVMFTALVSKQFRDIDKELTRFEKVYGGDLLNTVESSTEKMREQVKALAIEISSSYGIAASETAALAADIAQTGKEGEDLISSIKQTTRLAVLGEVERQEAMRATLSIQNAFKLNTNELSEAIDFLNAVENQTSTNLQDLAGAIPRVGPVIQALGGDIKDMSLLLVAMREGGVSAAEAANALKSGLGRLINPTKQARDVAASFGVSLEDIIQSSRGQLIPMIFGLQDALQGLDDFARAQVIEKVFGKYQFARMSALFANLRRQGSQTLSVMELASASSSELAGIANKELRALQESTAMRFQRTIENLKNSLLPLGELFTEGLIPILSAISSGVKGFLDFFQALPEPVQNFTKYAMIVTALAGPIVMLVGLFGNLIANGIKFSMMIVRMGAKIAGLRFEKFELLTSDVIAARMGVDNLTQSFVSQESALKRLVSAMSIYSVNLSNLMRTNPQLFVSGAATKRVTPLIKRQEGSTSPEIVPGGFGGGDRIPALLEPGEFVVRKEAARKYAPVLMQMNKGKLEGFQEGTRVYAHVTAPRKNVPIEKLMPYATPGAQKVLQAELASGRTTTTLFNNLVLQFTKTANNMLNAGKMTGIALAQQFKDVESWRFIMNKTGLSMSELQPVVSALESRFLNLGDELIDDPKMYAIVEQELKRLGDSGNEAAQVLSRLSDQFATFEYRRTDSPRPGRAGLGAMSYGVASYRGGKLGRFPQAKDFFDIETGKIIPGIQTGISRSTKSSSPSKEAESVGVRAGINIGNGAIKGLQKGMARVTSPSINPFTAAMQREAVRPRIFTPQKSISVANFDKQIAQISSQAGPSSPIGGPASSLHSARQAASSRSGMGGSGLMNAMFAVSMLTSSFSMLGGESNDLAIKLGLLTSAVMVASTAMQMFSGKNVLGNFLGLGSLGKKSIIRGRAMNVAAGGASRGGAALMKIGGALSMAGGPMGILGAGVIAGGIAGFIAYQNAAEKARERAVAAFADPAKTAEYFGTSLDPVIDKLKSAQAAIPGAEDIDSGLMEAVGEDYSTLIEKIRYGGAEAGARELAITFNSMLSSGLSEDQASEAVKAIATKAGASGGEAYAIAFRDNMFKEKTSEEIVQSLADLYSPEKMKPAIDQAQKTLDKALDVSGRGNVFSSFFSQTGGSIAQSIPDWLTESATTLGSFAANINITMQGIRGLSRLFGGFEPIEQIFDKDKAQETLKNAAETERKIHQMRTNIEEMADVTGSNIIKITEVMFQNFEKAPEEAMKAFDQILEAGKQANAVVFDTQPIKDYISEIDPIGGIILNAIIGDDEEVAGKVMQAIAAGARVQDIIDALTSGGVPELEILIKSKIDQQSLQNSINEMQSRLSEQSVMRIDIEIEDAEENLDNVKNKLENLDKVREIHEGVLKKAMNRANRASEAAIESMENEIDLIEQRADARREEFDETIQSLEDEKEKINESTDSYIKSIQQRQRIDDFYANQRKTSFSALEKLASGDVFGFLQERQQMAQDAQQFSYDEQIKGIEESRDRELDSIDKTIDAERKKQEQFEKNTEDRIKLINDEISAEQDSMDQRQKDFDRQMRFFDRRQQRRKEDLEDQKLALEEELTQLRTMRESAEAGTILKASEVSKRLGEEYAKPYIEEQKQIIKTQYMRELFQQDIGPTQAEENLRTRFFQLLDYLVAGTPGGGSRYITTDEILKLLGVSGSGSPVNRSRGGAVSGPGTPTSDSIPARLSNGEYVVRASSVSKYGKGMMDAINEARFAEGGFVGRATPKFLSGIQLPGKPTTPQSTGSTYNGSTYNDSGGYGDPTPLPSTSTGLIQHPSQGGPNKWPYFNYPKASGIIPGTSKNLYMNKDVLPLFLAFASDYNKLIRPIKTIYGIGARSGNYSNHPSGTAVDINPSEEGQYFGWGQSFAKKQAIINWWAGQKSALAPWDSISPTPYRTVAALMQKYKVLQWFGPRSQGGFINNPYSDNDPMHFQITQSRTISPGDVAATISSLGINQDGTFNRPRTYAAGGFVSGPGSSMSDKIPAMLSNGEYVVRASSVDKYGKGMLDQINAGQFGIGKFANGGAVGMYAGGGLVSPSYTIPMVDSGVSSNNLVSSNNTNMSTNNSTNVKIIVNARNSASAKAIASRVANMINSSNNRRNHSRSLG